MTCPSFSHTSPFFSVPLSLHSTQLGLVSLQNTNNQAKQEQQKYRNFTFMDSISNARRPCFIEEDDGLASLADMEAGFSGSHHPFFSRPMCYARRSGSFRNLSGMGSFSSSSSLLSPRSGRFCDARFEEHNHQPHFLEACFLCKKPIGENRDIFMYRGDTPFCSEECRDEQIEADEAKEKNFNLSSSMKALRKREQRKSNNTNSTTQDYPFHTSTVAAA